MKECDNSNRKIHISSMKIKAQNLKAAVKWIGCLASLSGRFDFHFLDLDYTCRCEDKQVDHPPDYTSS